MQLTPKNIFSQHFGTRRGRWQRTRQVLEESLFGFFNEDSLTISASIAYHSLLSMFPFLLLLIGLSGLFIQHYELTGRLAIVLGRYLPMKPDFIMQNLTGIARSYGPISLISFFLLLWSSSGVFLPLEKALNRAWEVKSQRGWWRKRLLALEMAVIVGLLVLVSSGLVGVNVYIHNRMRDWVPQVPVVLIELAYHALLIATTFSMSLAMFVVLFERLPNRRMQFRHVFPSALVTAVFWEAARSLFTLLLPRFNYRQIYGSIGAVVALMTWAYISSAVVLFGAQVSRALYRTVRLEGEITAETATPAVQGRDGAR